MITGNFTGELALRLSQKTQLLFAIPLWIIACCMTIFIVAVYFPKKND